MKEWPIPSCVKDLKNFLVLASYYRRFLQSFGTISVSLNKLIHWSSWAQHAFDTLEDALIKAPVLGFLIPKNNMFSTAMLVQLP